MINISTSINYVLVLINTDILASINQKHRSLKFLCLDEVTEPRCHGINSYRMVLRFGLVFSFWLTLVILRH